MEVRLPAAEGTVRQGTPAGEEFEVCSGYLPKLTGPSVRHGQWLAEERPVASIYGRIEVDAPTDLGEGAYLETGFEPGLITAGSPRKGSLNLREISGQNSRSTSKPMSCRKL